MEEVIFSTQLSGKSRVQLVRNKLDGDVYIQTTQNGYQYSCAKITKEMAAYLAIALKSFSEAED